jgi:putative CocE/NonD family hydrolase
MKHMENDVCIEKNRGFKYWRWTFCRLLPVCALLLFSFSGCVRNDRYLERHYTKNEFRIPMRDGKKLFTSVYSPKIDSDSYPILLWRTPYSVGPYGEDEYVVFRRETWDHFAREGYIVVFQDVRGRFMSEGEFINMRPHIPKKAGENDVDESTDTYDTIEWLIKNIPNHNGRVGIWGISYPGFYAAMGAIDAHPALKAVSPQAPIADWFLGDDIHHNGALSLAPTFPFWFAFGVPQPPFTTEWPEFFEYPVSDGYKFFLDLGPVKNVNEKYFRNEIPFWNAIMQHGNYDDFWKSRNNLPFLNNIKPAVLTVGGWFDAENAYGALQTYRAIEEKNPGARNTLVMGPWYHGGWVRSDGSSLGEIEFGSKTGEFYVKNIELPFFNSHLKNKDDPGLPEAYVFETGSDQWKRYEAWPPKNCEKRKLYLSRNGSLRFEIPAQEGDIFDEYVSDPSDPVPYTADITTEVPKHFMVEDQRFASGRSDVLSYITGILENDVIIAGPVQADIYASTTGTDSDWIVKLIDVFPGDIADDDEQAMKGYQMLLRGEIMRGKFRNSFEIPDPMIQGEVTHIAFPMNDLNHNFKKGHRIMVQIQSTWFPFFDRNPQKFTNIYQADGSDFQKATQRVYFSGKYPSGIILNILKASVSKQGSD